MTRLITPRQIERIRLLCAVAEVDPHDLDRWLDHYLGTPLALLDRQTAGVLELIVSGWFPWWRQGTPTRLELPR